MLKFKITKTQNIRIQENLAQRPKSIIKIQKNPKTVSGMHGKLTLPTYLTNISMTMPYLL